MKKLRVQKKKNKVLIRLAKMPKPGTRHVPLYYVTNRKLKEEGSFSAELSEKVSIVVGL